MKNKQPPSSEPEIYPPGTPTPGERNQMATGLYGTQRIYVAKLGPSGMALVALLVGAVAVAAVGLLLGAFLIGLVLSGIVAVGAVVSAALRGRLGGPNGNDRG